MRLDEQIDDALKRFPAWEPPADLVPRVIALAGADAEPVVSEPRAQVWARNILHGMSMAGVALVAGWVVSWSVDPYLRMMTIAANLVIKQPVALSWACAAISLLVAAMTTRRALA